MKQNCKRIFSLLLCAALVCTLFAGCGGRNKQLDIIYPITGDITSFDPQVAATQDEYLIAENCYEGLVRVEDDGTVKPAVAADWTVSTDQKTYTFHLRQGLKWHLTDAVTERMGKNWDPDITAHDFVFALQRAVSPQTACPLYPALSGIAGAQQVYTKQKSASALQVKATDDYTLVITLRTPDAGFFPTLSGAAAMPCNKEFFTATKGRYGLGTEYSLFNGQFYVKNQLDTSYTLNKNQEYKGANPTKVDNITLNIKDENSKVPEKLESGYYDAAFLTGSEYGALKKKDDLTAIPYANTTWAFLLNTNQGSLSNEKMRQSHLPEPVPGRYKKQQVSAGVHRHYPAQYHGRRRHGDHRQKQSGACQGRCPGPNPVESRVRGDRADHRSADSHYHPGDGRLRQGAGTGGAKQLGHRDHLRQRHRHCLFPKD